jgi:hypothetical protein
VASDPLIEWMKANNIPLKRDNYLALAFGADEPDDLGPEWEWPPELSDDTQGDEG